MWSNMTNCLGMSGSQPNIFSIACLIFIYPFVLSTVLLSSVKEARKGASTDGFKSSGKTFEADKCFSVIYGSDFKTLDLVCQNADEADIWTNGIKALKHHTGM